MLNQSSVVMVLILSRTKRYISHSNFAHEVFRILYLESNLMEQTNPFLNI